MSVFTVVVLSSRGNADANIRFHVSSHSQDKRQNKIPERISQRLLTIPTRFQQDYTRSCLLKQILHVTCSEHEKNDVLIALANSNLIKNIIIVNSTILMKQIYYTLVLIFVSLIDSVIK